MTKPWSQRKPFESFARKTEIADSVYKVAILKKKSKSDWSEEHTSLDKVSNAFNVVIQWLCVSEHVGVFFKQNIIRGTHVCLLLAAK